MAEREAKWELVAAADRARDRRDWQVAVSQYEAALSADPMLLPIWIQLGHARKEGGDRIGGAHAYLKALNLDIDHDDAWAELVALGWTRPLIFEALQRPLPAPQPLTPVFLALDVTDLVTHFSKSRTPTGIQRVQLQLIAAITEIDPASEVVYFDQAAEGWLQLPRDIFKEIYRSTSERSEVTASWAPIANWVGRQRRSSGVVQFAMGAALLNLGSSWAAKGYMPTLMAAQRASQVRYFPFVHDLIPLLHPETCTPGLPCAFETWLNAALEQADGIFVSSRAVAEDLRRYAGTRLPSFVLPVPLDGPFHSYPKRRLVNGSYVVMVATLESRKNHRLAFEVWERLVSERGLAKVPLLFCIGKDGPAAVEIRADLRRRPALRGVVQLVGPVDDDEIAAYYLGSLFVLCPSIYEGWGLPVSEALALGKPVIASKVGGHLDAGRKFVSYFDLSDPKGLDRAVRAYLDGRWRLLLDALRIRLFYRPRSWYSRAQSILDLLRSAS